MAVIRAVTMTVLLSFILVASAAGAFIYLLSGYPSPEVESFTVNSNDTGEQFLIETEALIRNRGADGEVRVDVRTLQSGNVVKSYSEEFFMARNETRLVRKEFSGESVENIGIAVFAPGRPDVIRDKSEILERIPEP